MFNFKILWYTRHLNVLIIRRCFKTDVAFLFLSALRGLKALRLDLFTDPAKGHIL
jgi:hypothetical protein